MIEIEEVGRDRTEKLPADKRRKLESAAMDLNELIAAMEEIKRRSQLLQNHRLNHADIKANADSIEKSVLEMQAIMAVVWLKIKDIGADIRPKYE